MFGGSSHPMSSQTQFGRTLASYEDIDMDNVTTRSGFSSNQSVMSVNQSVGSGQMVQQTSQQNQSAARPLASSAISNADYSDASSLTDEEIRAFTSDRFVFGSIPINPPMAEVC